MDTKPKEKKSGSGVLVPFIFGASGGDSTSSSDPLYRRWWGAAVLKTCPR